MSREGTPLEKVPIVRTTNGDLRRGHVGIWRFTGDERIEEVGAAPFER